MSAGLPDFEAGMTVLSASQMQNMVDMIRQHDGDIQVLMNSIGVLSLKTQSIKNETGDTLEVFEVAGIGDAIFDPTNDYSQFRSSILHEGDLPTTADYTGKFGIVIKPCANDGYGEIMIDSLVPVQINMNHTDDKYADVKNEDVTMLDSTPVGTARITWVESAGTGTKWAIVSLRNHMPRALIATGNESSNEVTVKAVDSLGVAQGFEITLVVLP